MPGKQLNSQARSFVANLLDYFTAEKENHGPLLPLNSIQEENCHNIADKYVEHDVVIIIIDLILLQKMAYRHVLFNSNSKSFWKLSVMILIMEAYSICAQKFPSHKLNKNPKLHDVDFDAENLVFYKLCAESTLNILSFILSIYMFSSIYDMMHPKRQKTSFLAVCHAITISSFGVFLHLPSIIWDVNKQSFHILLVSLYVSLSQLLAYSALKNCSKIWSIFVIYISSHVKAFVLDWLIVLYFL